MDSLYSDANKRKNNFDLLRFILAVTVVFTHSYVIYYGKVDNEPLWILSGNQLGFGTLALNFFFVISGFLVTQSWENSTSYLTFLKKRVLRIYPGFIVVCLASAFIFAPLGLGVPDAIHTYTSYISTVNIGSLIRTTLRLHGPWLPSIFKTNPFPDEINASLWTIQYEFVCYQAIPVLAFLGFFRKKVALIVCFISVIALNVLHYKAYQLYNTLGIFDFNSIPYYPRRYFNELLNFEHFLMFFLSGVIFYVYRTKIPRSIYLVAISLLILAATLWLKGFELVLPIFGTYLLLYFIFNKRIVFHNFIRYGDFSYGVYLYGWPIQQLVMFYIGKELNVISHFALSLLLIIPIAALSWHLIEKPFLNFKTGNFKLNRLTVRRKELN